MWFTELVPIEKQNFVYCFCTIVLFMVLATPATARCDVHHTALLLSGPFCRKEWSPYKNDKYLANHAF